MQVIAIIDKKERRVLYGGKSYRLPQSPFVSDLLRNMRENTEEISGEIIGSEFYPHVNGDALTQ